MSFVVYMILTKINGRYISYVGYTNNIIKRIKLHNTSKGAKFTKGNKWRLVYKKGYNKKTLALKKEFLLKNDKKKRYELKKEYMLENEN